MVADHRVIVILASRFPNDEARRTTVVEQTMDVAEWLRKQLKQAHPHLLRAMVKECGRGGSVSSCSSSLCGEYAATDRLVSSRRDDDRVVGGRR